MLSYRGLDIVTDNCCIIGDRVVLHMKMFYRRPSIVTDNCPVL